MKPDIESLIKKYNIRPYKGSWYVHETQLKEILQKIVDEVYEGAFSAGKQHGELCEYWSEQDD